jgi:hypothetical protein
MDNKTALVVAALIFGFFALDFMYLGWDAHIILTQKFLILIDNLAFWR